MQWLDKKHKNGTPTIFSALSLVWVGISCSLFFCGCSGKETLFEAIPKEKTGIHFSNLLQSTPTLNILNYIYFYNGAGVASADFNNDGLLDLYFSANQKSDKLYLNQGSFKFKDITAQASIENQKGWTNGVSIIDINQDGWMDIYLCKVGNHQGLKDHNQLYINQGVDANGQIHFSEESKKYGLDFQGYATQASFFDYDLDGDLDLFLLNHSINPNQNYGKGANREFPNKESGDKLYENINGHFMDVSEATGIFQSKIGYGLGVSVSDLNRDGFPDMYISNDFFENDYLYINQGNKTFKEMIHSNQNYIGHTTHFSMGNSISDLNNDGWPDILSLDMLPEDLTTYKTSGTEFNYQIYSNYLKNGYAPQYMQNTLQINNGNGSFSETGHLSGIAATEWSWSPLSADFDNDGDNDLYITNGILGATNDMDFINFIANDNIQQSLDKGMTEKEMAFIKKIPEKKTANYFYENVGNNQFEDATENWFAKIPSFSNGGLYADLDNDGDLDIVVNNVNEPAFILKNQSEKFFPERKHLKFSFQGPKNNIHGIGAKVILFHQGRIHQIQENFTTHGFLSSKAPLLHFGLDTLNSIDSLYIIWPDRKFEKKANVPSNQTIIATYHQTLENYQPNNNENSSLLTVVDSLFSFIHHDNTNLDFNRDPLLPFSYANEGPSIAVADINKDGLEDVFITGAKGQASALYLLDADGSFALSQEIVFAEDALHEDVAALFFDANADGYQDLIVASGGNEFKKGAPLTPKLYRNLNGKLVKDTLQFQGVFMNASNIQSVDLNNDGALDLCFLSNTLPQEFGHTPKQWLFLNDGKGNFTEITSKMAPAMETLGNCNDALWLDIDDNGYQDVIMVGDWMPLTLLKYNGKQFAPTPVKGFENSEGWWNVIKTADFDKDGDLDLVAGNWGLNTRLKANPTEPITLYKVDFDNNNSEETLVTYFHKGKETTLASKEELVKQMPFLNKKYLSFKEFAKASITDLFSEEKLQNALQKKVVELNTCYFENLGNLTFEKKQLPLAAQISSVNDIWIDDFNDDSYPDLLLVGNNYEISTQLGRLDASHGVLLLNDQNGWFSEKKGEQIKISGACRSIQKITINKKSNWIITRNNQPPLRIKKTKN